ncbi:MAG: GNAT family N-acetyltransferase [Anaerolineae bacterium]|nr:GNAT family N-acetyltransferase [Anaerolineae bacterium]
MATIIRAFDGSLDDAEGLLMVEAATFNESPYSPDEVRGMLTAGRQRAWLALGEGQVVGFVIGFVTHGLRGRCWEIDLLAVLPAWRGHGLATRLIRAASAHGARLAPRARAVIADDNSASRHAFERAGFRPAPEMCDLQIRRLTGLHLRSPLTLGVTVHEATRAAELSHWLPGLQALPQSAELSVIVAEQHGDLAGYAELIQVETLLYRGVWIESLVAHSRPARAALVRETTNRALVAGLDEVGAMVPDKDRAARQALRSAGFRSLGTFQWLVAELPLPGLASLPGGGLRSVLPGQGGGGLGV